MTRKTTQTDLTRLAEFMRRNPAVTTAALMRISGGSLSHIVEVKQGRSNPTIEFAGRIRAAASQILGRDVALDELFDVGPSSVERDRARRASR
jgi:hypothetical protein